MNTIDAALNIAWALLCIGALVWHCWRERQRARVQSRRSLVLRGVSVFLAAFLLFPCISVSDDYAQARLQDFNSTPNSHPVFGNRNSTSLAWAVQLEETEHIRPVAPFVLILVLCCLMSVLPEESVIQRSYHWDTPGRSPPSL